MIEGTLQEQEKFVNQPKRKWREEVKMNEPITINLDASSLSTAGCLLNLKRLVIDGYTEVGVNGIMNYGVACHKFWQIMYLTKGYYPTATQAAIESFNIPNKFLKDNRQQHMLDQRHMLSTAMGCWEMWIKQDKEFDLIELLLPCWKCKGNRTIPMIKGDVADETNTCPVCNGKKEFLQPACEVTFSIPYYKDNFIDVNLCGTIDSIGKIKGGVYAIRDFKTTSAWDARSYFGTYSLSKQLRMYKLALQLMSKLYPESVLGRIGATPVGAMIDAIFIKPSTNDNKYMRSEVYNFKPWDMEEFQSSLDLLIKRISNAVEKNQWGREGVVNGFCDRKFGKCSFWGVCNVDAKTGEALLNRDFKKKPFAPLNYNEH
jgi:hypothetical protein